MKWNVALVLVVLVVQAVYVEPAGLFGNLNLNFDNKGTTKPAATPKAADAAATTKAAATTAKPFGLSFQLPSFNIGSSNSSATGGGGLFNFGGDSKSNGLGIDLSGFSLGGKSSGKDKDIGSQIENSIKKLTSGDIPGALNGLKSAFEDIQKLVSNPTDLINAITKVVTEAFKKSVDEILKNINKIFKGDDALSKTIRNAANNIEKPVLNTFNKIATTISSILKKEATLENGLKEIVNTLVDALESAITIFTTAIGDITGNPELSKLLNNGVKEIEDLLKKIDPIVKGLSSGKSLDEVAAGVIEILEKITKVLGDSGVKIVNTVLNKDDAITEGIKFVSSGLIEVSSDLGVGILSEIRSGLVSRDDPANIGIKLISVFGNTVEKFIEMLQKAAGSFLKSDNKLAKSLTKTINKSISFGVNFITQPIDIISQVLEAIWNDGDDASLTLKQTVLDALKDIKSITETVASNVKGVIFNDISIKTGISNLVILGIEKGNKANTDSLQAAQKLLSSGKNAEGEITKVVLNELKTLESTSNSVSEILSQLVNGELTPKEAFEKIAEEIIETILSSLKAILKTISNAIGSKPLKALIDETIEPLENVFSTSLTTLLSIASGKTDPKTGSKKLIITGLDTAKAIIKSTVNALPSLFPKNEGIRKLLSSGGETLLELTDIASKLANGQVSVNDAIAKGITIIITYSKKIAEIVDQSAKNGLTAVGDLGKQLENSVKDLLKLGVSNIKAVGDGSIKLNEACQNIIIAFVDLFANSILDLLKKSSSLLTGDDKLTKLLSKLNDGLIDGVEIGESALKSSIKVIVGVDKGNVKTAIPELVKINVNAFSNYITAISKVLSSLDSTLNS